jgi:hypothetical protein
MEWSKANQPDEAAATPVERVSFDVIRTLSAVRQAASPTIQAVRAAAKEAEATPAPDHPAMRIELFSGHRRTADEVLTGGAFLTAPKRDNLCADKDKNDA